MAAEIIKIGHVGIPLHEQVMRLLTKDENFVVINKQGAKGYIGYKALESGEIDFLVVPNSSALLSPMTDKNLFNFMPTDKFRFISLIASVDPVFIISPLYKSIDDLISKKQIDKTTVLSADVGEESSLITSTYFKLKNISVTQVLYNGGGTAPLIDTLAGRADITIATESVAQNYVDKGITYIKFKDIKNSPLNKVSINIFLLTRKDMPQEKINTLIEKCQSNIDNTKELQKSGKVNIIVSSEKETQIKLEEYNNFFKKLLNKN
jgi:hypothetical protein